MSVSALDSGEDGLSARQRGDSAVHFVANGGYVSCGENGCEQAESGYYSSLTPAELATRSAERLNPWLADQQDRMPIIAASTESLLDWSRSIEGDEPVSFTVELMEEPTNDADFDGLSDVRTDPAEREEWIAQRRERLAPSQREFIAQAAELGAIVESTGWLTNVVDVSSPAPSVAEILALPGVVGASRDADDMELHSADGWERQIDLDAVATAADGGTGGRAGGEVRVAVIEVREGAAPNTNRNFLYTGHPAWLDWAGGPSRVIDTDNCKLRGTRRRCLNSASATAPSHGTNVAGVLLGSIEQGQDSNFPGSYTVSQDRRSGLAREAELLYYHVEDGGQAKNIRVAIETAVADGADLINLSLGSSHGCNLTYDAGGIGGAISAAENAGVMVVASAGNDGAPIQCNVNWLAVHRDTIGVSGLNTFWDFVPYEDTLVSTGSSWGHKDVTLHGGAIADAPMPLLSAQFNVDLLPNGQSTPYAPSQGTSFSAPIVTSLAVLARQNSTTYGLPYANDAWGTGIQTLLMGDAAHGSSTAMPLEVSERLGFGRARYRGPASSLLGGIFHWEVQNFQIYDGQTITLNVGPGSVVSSGADGFALALYVDKNSYSSLPDLRVEVVDVCPIGRPPVDGLAVDLAGMARVVLDEYDTRVRCLRIVVEGESVRSGGDSVWLAYLYHSRNHDDLFEP